MSPCVLAFLAGSPGLGEMLVLFLAVLILFGPRRLPDLARRMGRLLADLRNASQDFRDQLMSIEEAPAAPGSDRDETPGGGTVAARETGSVPGEPAAGEAQEDPAGGTRGGQP